MKYLTTYKVLRWIIPASWARIEYTCNVLRMFSCQEIYVISATFTFIISLSAVRYYSFISFFVNSTFFVTYHTLTPHLYLLDNIYNESVSAILVNLIWFHIDVDSLAAVIYREPSVVKHELLIGRAFSVVGAE